MAVAVALAGAVATAEEDDDEAGAEDEDEFDAPIMPIAAPAPFALPTTSKAKCPPTTGRALK